VKAEETLNPIFVSGGTGENGNLVLSEGKNPALTLLTCLSPQVYAHIEKVDALSIFLFCMIPLLRGFSSSV
jgi:hypothetical protein